MSETERCHIQEKCSVFCETRHYSKTLLFQSSIELTCPTSTHTWILSIQDHCIRTSHSVHHSAKRSAFHFSCKEPSHRVTSEVAKDNTWHKIKLQRLDLFANNPWEELHPSISQIPMDRIGQRIRSQWVCVTFSSFLHWAPSFNSRLQFIYRKIHISSSVR